MIAGRSSNAYAIGTTDAQVRSLYRCLQSTGASHTDLAISLHTLHTVLKELRSEAGKPLSLINTTYASQLPPLLEACGSTLQQLDTLVREGHSQTPPSGADDVNTSAGIHLVHTRINDHIASLRSYLERAGPQDSENEPAPVAAPDFSSTQSGSMSPMPPDDERLETIQSRVDAIARRLAHQDLLTETLSPGPSSDALWRVFYDELLYEGFSDAAISQNEEPLRAYVLEVYSRSVPQGRDMPTPQQPPPYTISSPEPPIVLQPAVPGESCLKEDLQPPETNEKYMASIKQDVMGNRAPIPIRPALHLEPGLPAELPAQEQQQQHRQQFEQQLVFSPTAMAAQLSPARTGHMHYTSASASSSPTMGGYTPNSSLDDDPDSDPSFEFHLISTSKLLAIDWRVREAYAARASLAYRSPMLLQQAQPASPGPEASTALVVSPVSEASIPARPGLSPHLQPVQPGPVLSSSAPQTSSVQPSAFGVIIPARNSVPNGASHGLAPDSKGIPIPPDAVWTKINRRLVSPEVLEKAGVRYEARPTFVAVLGVLSREQIVEYARQSAEARKARLPSNRRQSWSQNRPSAPGHASESTSLSRDSTRVYRTQSVPIASQESGPVPATINKAQTFPASSSARPTGRDGPRSPTSDRDPAYVVGNGEYFTAGDRRSSQKSYPFIVSPPIATADAEPRSPQGTIRPDLLPKSILKNKNTNQVRVKDGRTVEVSPDGTTSSQEQGHGRRDRSRHRGHGHRHSHSERDRHHDRGEQREKGRRHHEDRSRTRDSHKEPERDRDRSRRDDRKHERNKSRDRSRNRDRSRGRDRSRDRVASPQRTLLDLFSRDYRETREGRSRLRDTIGAASIGGAAGSILTALTEAASSM